MFSRHNVTIFAYVLLGCIFIQQSALGAEVEMDTLTIESTGKDKFLIPEGFPFQNDIKLNEEIVIAIKKVEAPKGGGIFFIGENVPLIIFGSAIARTEGEMVFPPTFTEQKLDIKNTGNTSPLVDAVGITWKFLEQGQTFTVKGIRFTSLEPGATIQFTKNGVLVSGFSLTPAHK